MDHITWETYFLINFIVSETSYIRETVSLLTNLDVSKTNQV